jgi:hypothetical protein
MLYNVRLHNFKEYHNDTYMVEADDPVQARGVAIMRLVEETGTGLDQWEIIDVEKRA